MIWANNHRVTPFIIAWLQHWLERRGCTFQLHITLNPRPFLNAQANNLKFLCAGMVSNPWFCWPIYTYKYMLVPNSKFNAEGNHAVAPLPTNTSPLSCKISHNSSKFCAGIVSNNDNKHIAFNHKPKVIISENQRCMHNHHLSCNSSRKKTNSSSLHSICAWVNK